MSKSTVSYYLNGTKNLKPDTQEKIREAINSLDYLPRVAARSLKTKQTQTIGIVVPDITNSFFTDIICGIEDAAFQSGFSVVLCNTREDKARERQYLNMLISKDIDGLIVISAGRSRSVIGNLNSFPVVAVDRKVSENVSTVCSDNVLGGYMATKHLLESHGYPVQVITGGLEINTYNERLAGYIKAHEELRLPFNKNLVHETDISYERGYSQVMELIHAGCDMKSIFAASDVLALGALKALSQSGYKVGEGVFLVGYDDSEINTVLSPALSSVCQPKYEMGIESAKLLIRQIVEKRKIVDFIVMRPNLVVRGTS